MTGYCKWCDTLTNSIVKQYEEGILLWVGCPDCFVKKKGVRETKEKKKEPTHEELRDRHPERFF